MGGVHVRYRAGLGKRCADSATSRLSRSGARMSPCSCNGYTAYPPATAGLAVGYERTGPPWGKLGVGLCADSKVVA